MHYDSRRGKSEHRDTEMAGRRFALQLESVVKMELECMASVGERQPSVYLVSEDRRVSVEPTVPR